MKNFHNLYCPNCGAKPEDGTEFLVVEQYRGERTGLIEGVTPEGVLVPSQMDTIITRINELRTIVCTGCKHEWGTRRAISNIWE